LNQKIFLYSVKNNWVVKKAVNQTKMPPGEPGGPDSEVFMILGGNSKSMNNLRLEIKNVILVVTVFGRFFGDW